MPWDPPGPVDDMAIAALPFPTAQRLLQVGRIVRHSLLTTRTEWHGDGADGDPRRGSYAMVRVGGPLEELVGERLKIRYGRHTVYAYCHRSADLDDDMSLTRSLYARLVPLSVTNVLVRVEIVGEAPS